MEQTNKSKTELIIQIGLIAVLVLILTFNVGKLVPKNSTGSNEGPNIIPRGIPLVYGKELGVSYDDVSPQDPIAAENAISKLRQFEDKQLTQNEMTRYLRIGQSISCEYCCGAATMIFPNGERACGCAHSYAMRGLAKYLLRTHPEMKDEEILSELGKWKVLFFPDVHKQKAQVLESKGINPNDYINLASNKYRGIETNQANGGGMVGGC